MASKQSCRNEPLSTVKQELVNRTDDYVSKSVDYPLFRNEHSIDLNAVKVEPYDVAIELDSPSVAHVNIKIESKQKVVECSSNKAEVGSYGVDMVADAETGVADMLGGTSVEPVLESIKCEPELIQGLDDGLPHQSTLEPTRAPADRLSTKANVQVESFKNNSSSATKEQFKKHPNVKTSGKPYQCNKCSFSTARKYSLKLHATKHSGDKPFQCNQCSYTAATKYRLKEHAAIHAGVKPFQCDKCSYSAATKRKLKEHAPIHTYLSLKYLLRA